VFCHFFSLQPSLVFAWGLFLSIQFRLRSAPSMVCPVALLTSSGWSPRTPPDLLSAAVPCRSTHWLELLVHPHIHQRSINFRHDPHGSQHYSVLDHSYWRQQCSALHGTDGSDSSRIDCHTHLGCRFQRSFDDPLDCTIALDGFQSHVSSHGSLRHVATQSGHSPRRH
jgi:hypothetical protein